LHRIGAGLEEGSAERQRSPAAQFDS